MRNKINLFSVLAITLSLSMQAVNAANQNPQEPNITIPTHLKVPIPEYVREFVYNVIAENCKTDGYIYSAIDVELDSDEHSDTYYFDLAVGEDYPGDTFITVEEIKKNLADRSEDHPMNLVELGCP